MITGARGRAALIWMGLAASVGVPLAIAWSSPLLAWREPVYIIAGIAGVLALALLLVQPLLARGFLPGVPAPRGRRIHRWVGAALVAAVIVHVVGLWVTSPPDVLDALMFRSPTPFAVWGVVAMWAVLVAAMLAVLRRRLRLRPAVWRRGHLVLASIIVVGSVIHALLIEGTMGTVSKALLCALVLSAAAVAVATAGRTRQKTRA